MNQSHLSEERLIEICATGCASAADEQHLIACTSCGPERAALARLLLEITGATAVEADSAFSSERLSRQRARILHRLDLEGRPARVIAFPAVEGLDQPVRPTRALTRWVAAAAAAGLLVGLVAGHLTHDLSSGLRTGSLAQAAVTRQVVGTSMRNVTAPISDDQLLDEIELAVDSGGPAALRPLDALTPRAWEVR